jgi:ABC-type uncharacterized transport system substrate-binding protein
MLSLLGVLLLLALPERALAHPHVFIDNITTFVFSGEQLSALRLRWTFDELTGTAIARQYDQNRTGAFEPAEMEKLEAGSFANLRDYGYFVDIRINGNRHRIDKVTGFRGSIRDGLLIYEFTVPLPSPVDPATAEVIVAIYDETYFVEVSLDAKDPVRFDGMRPGKCSFAVRDADGSLTAFGIAPFQMVTLTCRKAP